MAFRITSDKEFKAINCTIVLFKWFVDILVPFSLLRFFFFFFRIWPLNLNYYYCVFLLTEHLTLILFAHFKMNKYVLLLFWQNTFTYSILLVIKLKRLESSRFKTNKTLIDELRVGECFADWLKNCFIAFQRNQSHRCLMFRFAEKILLIFIFVTLQYSLSVLQTVLFLQELLFLLFHFTLVKHSTVLDGTWRGKFLIIMLLQKL